MDIPLSQPFLKLVIHSKVNNQTTVNDLDGVLNLDDFEEVHPVKGEKVDQLFVSHSHHRSILERTLFFGR